MQEGQRSDFLEGGSIAPSGFAPVETRGMDEFEIEVYENEREFLYHVGDVLSGGDVNLRDTRLFLLMEDLVSTRAATEVFHAYGFGDSCWHSDNEIERRLRKRGKILGPPVQRKTVSDERRIVLGSLWILFERHMEGGAFQPSRLFRERYDRAFASSDRSRTLVGRSSACVSTWSDREAIRGNEDNILRYVTAFFGRQYAELAARYYRLGEYRERVSFGTSGNISGAELNKRRISVSDSVNAIHAVYDTLSGNVNRVWTQIGGKVGKPGYYFRMNDPLKRALVIHERCSKIQERVERSEESGLNYLERELLQDMLDAYWAGLRKEDAVEMFRRRHGVELTEMTLNRTEKVCLGQEGSNLVQVMRKERASRAIKSPVVMSQIVERVKGVAAMYYNRNQSYSLDQIGDELNISRDYVWSLRRCLDVLLTGSVDIPGRRSISQYQIEGKKFSRRVKHFVHVIVRNYARANSGAAISRELRFVRVKGIKEMDLRRGINGVGQVLDEIVEDTESTAPIVESSK